MHDIVGIQPKMNNRSWEVNLSGPELKQLETHYMHIDENERTRIFLTAAKILSNCPNPLSVSGRKTGLGLGKVQSGKTATFTSLIALAYDNSYRVVIVFAGTKKNLLSQTNRRIKKQLGVEVRTDRKLAVFSTLDDINSVRKKDINGVLKNGNNVLITILKHHKHIDYIKELFDTNDLNFYSTLIIDDEGDQASLNALVHKGKQTPTYKKILELRNALKLHAYISITATPQANLLIKTMDELSPEFCVLINPGAGYTGGTTFHGINQGKYIKVIPDNEVPFEDKGGIPESFINALSIFLIGATIRTLRNDTSFHSMLVHTSSEKQPHKAVSEKVEALVEKWTEKLLLSDGDPGKAQVLNIIYKNYMDMCNSDNNYPSWDIVASMLCKEITQLRTWIVNSSDLGMIPTPDNMYFRNNIFIGGNMLDRGVTLEGLAVTYITRWSKKPQADTIEQRARWFGYKQSYLDICRIFMTTDVKEGFAHLLGHEDDLWEQLRGIEKEGIPIKMWPRLIAIAKPFNPTRSNVAKYKKLNYDGWIIQKKPDTIEFNAAHNINVIQGFFSTMTFEDHEFGKITHRIIRDCSIKEAKEKLLDRLIFSQNEECNELFIIELIKRIVKTKKFPTIDVVLMKAGKIEERSIYGNGKIKNLMQGSSVRIPETSPDYYVGDRNFHCERIQLQIHIVKLKQGDFKNKIALLALYTPEAVSWEIGRLLKGDVF